MLQISEIKERIAYVYHNGVYIGILTTQYQLNDIRLQVKEGQLEGVYLGYYDEEHEYHHIEIKPSGSLSHWPKGFFDLIERQLSQLVFDKK